MELRVLRYFLAIAREENITAAAEYLHVSQPTLSRQIQDLEAEFGRKLLVRGSRRISLTPEGQLLRKRAEEIVTLADRTEMEIQEADRENIEGDIHIGAGESYAIHLITRPFHQLQKKYPGLHLNIVSGDTEEVLYQLDSGLIDFGVLFHGTDTKKYNAITFDYEQAWVVIMRKDHPLAGKKELTYRDLKNQPVILSRSAIPSGRLAGIDISKLNVVCTYTLAYNASLMAEDGIGIVPTFADLINTEGTDLVQIPLKGEASHMTLVWKKYQTLSRQAELLLETIRESGDLL
jgi:DNA-binding transcriptional LysR family regulator